MGDNIQVVINGKTFAEIYINSKYSKYKEKPIKVKNWYIMKNNILRAGSFELDKECINPSILELFGV